MTSQNFEDVNVHFKFWPSHNLRPRFLTYLGCIYKRMCVCRGSTSPLNASIALLASLIAGSKMCFQKIDQSFSPFLETGFCKNNLSATIFALQKVALVWIFYVLHVITADILQYILCLNISIISNLDICPKFDIYAAHTQKRGEG